MAVDLLASTCGSLEPTLTHRWTASRQLSDGPELRAASRVAAVVQTGHHLPLRVAHSPSRREISSVFDLIGPLERDRRLRRLLPARRRANDCKHVPRLPIVGVGEQDGRTEHRQRLARREPLCAYLGAGR